MFSNESGDFELMDSSTSPEQAFLAFREHFQYLDADGKRKGFFSSSNLLSSVISYFSNEELTKFLENTAVEILSTLDKLAEKKEISSIPHFLDYLRTVIKNIYLKRLELTEPTTQFKTILTVDGPVVHSFSIKIVEPGSFESNLHEALSAMKSCIKDTTLCDRINCRLAEIYAPYKRQTTYSTQASFYPTPVSDKKRESPTPSRRSSTSSLGLYLL